MTAPKVVFVSHNASRSGAPLLLLAFQRWLLEHAELEISTVLLEGGPLEADFSRVGAMVGVEDLASTSADLVYLNTVGSAPALEHLAEGPSVICHVHELDFALNHWISATDRDRLRHRVDRFIVVSDMVHDAVSRCLGVEHDRMVRHYGFIDVAAVRRCRRTRAPGTSGPAALVGTSGTTEWRKAPDLFLGLARLVRQSVPEARFRWVGGVATGPEIDPVLRDRERVGLGSAVEFIGEQPDARPWFAAYDVFALLSRDDPFPLTCLEAAALGVPVVAFDSTGAREFLSDGCGIVVPYPDLEAMADEVAALLGDPEHRRSLTAAAGRRVLAEHDIGVAAPRLLAEMQEVLAS